LASYYRRFIHHFADLAAPLHELLKKDKDFKWTKECQKAFETLKTRLISAPILVRSDLSKEFLLFTDASSKGLGIILSQLDNQGEERVIGYTSRALHAGEPNYGATKLKCLAVVYGIKHYRHYL
jgi:hypothetical protein